MLNPSNIHNWISARSLEGFFFSIFQNDQSMAEGKEKAITTRMSDPVKGPKAKGSHLLVEEDHSTLEYVTWIRWWNNWKSAILENGAVKFLHHFLFGDCFFLVVVLKDACLFDVKVGLKDSHLFRRAATVEFEEFTNCFSLFVFNHKATLDFFLCCSKIKNLIVMFACFKHKVKDILKFLVTWKTSLLHRILTPQVLLPLSD